MADPKRSHSRRAGRDLSDVADKYMVNGTSYATRGDAAGARSDMSAGPAKKKCIVRV
jgi:hypothetical protein